VLVQDGVVVELPQYLRLLLNLLKRVTVNTERSEKNYKKGINKNRTLLTDTRALI